MADDRKFTNNSDTDDYIFDDEEDLSLEEIELNEENDGYKSGTPDGTEPSARGSKGRRTYIIRAAVIAAVVVILVAAGIMIERFVPNKKAVNLNEYYRTSVGNALIYNYDITEYSSLVVNWISLLMISRISSIMTKIIKVLYIQRQQAYIL